MRLSYYCIVARNLGSSRAALQRGPVTRGVLRLAKHLTFEVLESNHHHSHIVEGLSVEGIFQNTLNCQPTLLVHILCQFELFVIYCDTVPHAARDVLVR